MLSMYMLTKIRSANSILILELYPSLFCERVGIKVCASEWESMLICRSRWVKCYMVYNVLTI